MQDLVLALMLTVCLVTDLRSRKIYNLVIFPVLIFGIGFNFVTGGGAGLLQSLWGTLAGLGILIIPFVLGGMGAGDVKLLAVIGAVKGPMFIVYTAIGMGLAGGVIALAIILYQRNFHRIVASFLQGGLMIMLRNFRISALNLDNEKIMFPYGLAITIGAMGAFWWMR